MPLFPSHLPVKNNHIISALSPESQIQAKIPVPENRDFNIKRKTKYLKTQNQFPGNGKVDNPESQA